MNLFNNVRVYWTLVANATYKDEYYIYELKEQSHVVALKLTNKLDLSIGEKTIALSNLRIYCTLKNIKNSCNTNKFEISAPTWNDKLELPDCCILC